MTSFKMAESRICYCRIQLVGIACLTAAMGDTVRSVRVTDQEIDLDAQLFAYASNGTWTPEQVESMTKTVVSNVPEHVKDAPNAKTFLQELAKPTGSLWDQAIISRPLSAKMQVYTVAR